MYYEFILKITPQPNCVYSGFCFRLVLNLIVLFPPCQNRFRRIISTLPISMWYYIVCDCCKINNHGPSCLQIHSFIHPFSYRSQFIAPVSPALLHHVQLFTGCSTRNESMTHPFEMYSQNCLPSHANLGPSWTTVVLLTFHGLSLSL